MVDVTSEVGRLRVALVHEPGFEVDRMVPAMMEELLFDDILYGERARDEHGRFRRLLQLFGIEVHDADDLLHTALEQERAREWMTDVLFQDLAESDREWLLGLPIDDLVSILVCGSPTRLDPSGVEAEDLYQIPPVPNWCFQRDPQIVLGRGVVFSSMAAAARHREGLLTRAIFRFHPMLADVPVLFDPLSVDRARSLFLDPERPSLEGGDVLVFGPDVIAVGLSERTNRPAVRHLARALARAEPRPRFMIVVRIPRRRAYMHLDTLITAVDRDACLVYQPVLLGDGPERAEVYEFDLHEREPRARAVDGLLRQLALRGLDLEPIPCGGGDPVTQQREQWTDGANALALAPGRITIYDRNVATAGELDRRGFRIVSAEDLLLGREEIDRDEGGRVCVLLSSHEMSRARGGPHCLVHPLVRDRMG